MVALLATGDNAGATPGVDISGPWATVYSQDTPAIANVGDCTSVLAMDGAGNVTSTTLSNCTSNGAPTASNGDWDAVLNGFNLTGVVHFTGFDVTGSATVSPDGKSMSGPWDAGGQSGTWEAAQLVDTSGTGDSVTFPGAGPSGASLTFVGTGSGDTAIISAPTSGGNIPPDFQLVGQYYHVVTTYSGTGPYVFCGSYPGTTGIHDIVGGMDENFLKIGHNEPPLGFVPYPRHPDSDPVANVVCAEVTSLSDFAVMAPLVAPVAVGGLVEIVIDGSSFGGSTWPSLAAIMVSAIAFGTAAMWLGRRRTVI